jgi:ADP-dependent glucokinase
LPNLFSILNHGSVTLISDAYPRVACVLDQMRSVFSMLRHTPSTDGKRPLTRLHVHTLAYQAIMTVKSSVWQDSRGAAAKASLTANRHICGAADIDASKAKILMDDSFSSSREEGSTRIPFDPKQPVSCWEEDGGTIEICIAPVLVCLDVKQTAGGGDNISSAGLVYNV